MLLLKRCKKCNFVGSHFESLQHSVDFQHYTFNSGSLIRVQIYYGNYLKNTVGYAGIVDNL